MATPTRDEILEKAQQMYMEQEYTSGMDLDTLPTPTELQEEGLLAAAQTELMQTGKSYVEENGEYLDVLQKTIKSFGYVCLPKKEMLELKKCCRIRTKPVVEAPIPKKIVVKKPVIMKKAIVKKVKKAVVRPKKMIKRLRVERPGVIFISDEAWGIKA